LVGRRIFGLMGNEYAGGIHVVAATKDGRTEYWAASVPESRALEEVRQKIPAGWHLSLTNKRLSTAKAAGLKMRLNSVRQLNFVP
jgi:hypothetical protein